MWEISSAAVPKERDWENPVTNNMSLEHKGNTHPGSLTSLTMNWSASVKRVMVPPNAISFFAFSS